MSFGKILIFIAGLVGGGALLFATQFAYQGGSGAAITDVADALTISEPVSPFAIVEEPENQRDAEVQAELSTSEVDSASIEPIVSADELSDLRLRITEAELRISELELALNEPSTDDSPEEDDGSSDLLLAGFEPTTVNEIETIRNNAQLQRLELTDQATREGWINTDRYRQARRDLFRGRELRDSLGDDNYDKLLIAEGRNNRVRIEGVMDSSAAEGAGIEQGDVVLRYADERIFSFRDLQSATTSGSRDESVTIQVIRDGETIDLVIPRGPMGVNLIGITDNDDS